MIFSKYIIRTKKIATKKIKLFLKNNNLKILILGLLIFLSTFFTLKYLVNLVIDKFAIVNISLPLDYVLWISLFSIAISRFFELNIAKGFKLQLWSKQYCNKKNQNQIINPYFQLLPFLVSAVIMFIFTNKVDVFRLEITYFTSLIIASMICSFYFSREIGLILIYFVLIFSMVTLGVFWVNREFVALEKDFNILFNLYYESIEFEKIKFLIDNLVKRVEIIREQVFASIIAWIGFVVIYISLIWTSPIMGGTLERLPLHRRKKIAQWQSFMIISVSIIALSIIILWMFLPLEKYTKLLYKLIHLYSIDFH